MSSYGSSRPHLIVGGTTKAASSSLFSYLAAHPQVCPAQLKETRYFLDDDYPLPRPVRADAADYARLYAAYRPGQVCVEATPDYLHSPGTARRIAESLPQARLLFILREPVSRLRSWYRFARQLGLLDEDVSFARYVQIQLETNGVAPGQPQHLRALTQGRYSEALPAYLEHFGARVQVVWFETLRASPRAVATSVAAAAGIDPAFYEGYLFDVVNPTADVRSPRLHGGLVRTGRRIRSVVHRYPRLRALLRAGKGLALPAYRRLNETGAAAGPQIDAVTLELLAEYYAGEAQRLEALIGQRPPWGAEAQP